MKKLSLSKCTADIRKFNPQQFDKNDIGIEIQSFHQHLLDDGYENLTKEYNEKLKGFNGSISLHGSSFDLNPGSTDKQVLKLTKFRYLESINIGKSLGASYVIFHSQLNPLLKVEKIKQIKIKNQIEFWKELLNDIEDIDINILIENEYEDSYKDLLYIIEEINSPKIKVCLDIGHVLAYSKLELEEWVLGLNNHIKYIHLHWNDRQWDSHDAPERENLELLSDILREANINPTITLEYGYDMENLDGEIQRVREALLP